MLPLWGAALRYTHILCFKTYTEHLSVLYQGSTLTFFTTCPPGKCPKLLLARSNFYFARKIQPYLLQISEPLGCIVKHIIQNRSQIFAWFDVYLYYDIHGNCLRHFITKEIGNFNR